jgi:ankyrin repeat protein
MYASGKVQANVLLSAGANESMCIRDNNAFTAMDYALHYDDVEMIGQLQKYGGDRESPNQDKISPLGVAKPDFNVSIMQSIGPYYNTSSEAKERRNKRKYAP